MTAVDFYNKLPFQTHEIDNVGTDDVLASKFGALHLTVLEVMPNSSFGICLVSS